MKRAILLLALSAAICAGCAKTNGRAGGPETSAAQVWRTNPDGSRQTLATVRYYVSGDTLYVDKKFKNVGFMYSDTKTGRMVLKQRSLLFRGRKKGSWWYVPLREEPITAPEQGAKLSGIALRGYDQGPAKPGTVRRAADAYIYNATREVPSWKGPRALNRNTAKIARLTNGRKR